MTPILRDVELQQKRQFEHLPRQCILELISSPNIFLPAAYERISTTVFQAASIRHLLKLTY